MNFRHYPYSYPFNNNQNPFVDDRIFPGGAGGGGTSGLPGLPPSGFPGPGFPPSPPPGSLPGGGQQQEGPPSSPPPSFTPQLQQGISPFAVDPGAIRGCLFRFTFVWLNNGHSFWFYPTFVGRTSVAGWRWRNFRWTFYGTDLRRIRNFQCF